MEIINNIQEIKFKIEKSLIYLKAFDELNELINYLEQEYENILNDFSFNDATLDNNLIDYKIIYAKLDIFYKEKILYLIGLSKRDNIYDDIKPENIKELNKIKNSVELLLNSINLSFKTQIELNYNIILNKYEIILNEAKEYNKSKITSYIKDETNTKLSLYQDMNYIIKIEQAELNTFIIDNKKYLDIIDKNNKEISELIAKINEGTNIINEPITFDIKENESNNYSTKINNQNKYINELNIFYQTKIKTKLDEINNKKIIDNLLNEINTVIKGIHINIQNKIPKQNNLTSIEYINELKKFINFELNNIDKYKEKEKILFKLYDDILDKLNVLINFNKPLYDELYNKLNNIEQEFNKKMNIYLNNNTLYKSIPLVNLYIDILNNYYNVYIININKSIELYNEKEKYIEYLSNLQFNNIENEKLEQIDNFVSKNATDDEKINDLLYKIIYYYFNILVLNDKEINLNISNYGMRKIDEIYTKDVINESKKENNKKLLSYISISNGFDINKYKEFIKTYKTYLNDQITQVEENIKYAYQSKILSLFKMNNKNVELIEEDDEYFLVIDGIKSNYIFPKTDYKIEPQTIINSDILKCYYKGRPSYVNIENNKTYSILSIINPQDYNNGYVMIQTRNGYAILLDNDFNEIIRVRENIYINTKRNFTKELIKNDRNCKIFVHYIWPNTIIEVKTNKSTFYSANETIYDGTIVLEKNGKKAIYDLEKQKFITKYKYKDASQFINGKAVVNKTEVIDKENNVITTFTQDVLKIFDDGSYVVKCYGINVYYDESSIEVKKIFENSNNHKYMKNDKYLGDFYHDGVAMELYDIKKDYTTIFLYSYLEEENSQNISNDVFKLGIKSNNLVLKHKIIDNM